MLDANIKAQLQSYFTKLRRPIVLKAALDGSQDATNIEAGAIYALKAEKAEG